MGEEEMVKMVRAIYKANFSGCGRIKEDMIQEGLLGVLMAERLYDESKGVSRYTFAWNYAKGKMLNFYQKERAYHCNMSALPDLDLYEGTITDYSGESDRDKTIREVYECLNEIDPRSKDIFIGVIKGEKQKDIAEKLGISRQLVNIKYKRTAEKIRKNISKSL